MDILKFEAQDEIEIYADGSGFICFSAFSEIEDEHKTVRLTIGQFRKVLKYSEMLITQAEYKKENEKAAK